MPRKKQKLLNTELCKLLLVGGFGYSFCYTFLLDYSVEGMNIFHRNSTTSITGLAHPALFAVYTLLMGLGLFVNLGYARERYRCKSRIVAALQYAGLAGMLVVALVETDLAHGPKFYVHTVGAVIYAAANGFCLFSMIGVSRKSHDRMRPLFYFGFVFMSLTITGFATKLCGFTESAPTLTAMVILYFVNYTDVFFGNRNNEAKQSKKERKAATS